MQGSLRKLNGLFFQFSVSDDILISPQADNQSTGTGCS